MFLDDIFDGKGADDKLDIFNPAELLQNSWSDGSHQQIFAPPNPSNLLPSIEFGSGADRVQAKGFLSRIGLPDFGELPGLPGLPGPGDLPTPPLPRLGELPQLPGLPAPGDIARLPVPQLPRLGDLPRIPGLPSAGDLPVPPLPRLGELPRIPGLPTPGDMTPPHPRFGDLPRPGFHTPPELPPFSVLDGFLGGLPPANADLIRLVNEDLHDRGIVVEGRPTFRPIEPGLGEPGPNRPAFGSGHCDNGGEQADNPITTLPSPIDVWIPEEEGSTVKCPEGDGQGQGDGEQAEVVTQGPNYDNVTKEEIKDVLDKHFEDIDGSNASELRKLFGFDKNGRVDSKEIMDFVMKNMDKLSDREIRVLLSASQKEGEISNAYDDEWGAENSGMSRSDVAVWERQKPRVGIPEDEIVFKPFDRDPSIWMDKRYPMPSLDEQFQGPSNHIDKHDDLRWWDNASYKGGSLQNVDKNRSRPQWT